MASCVSIVSWNVNRLQNKNKEVLIIPQIPTGPISLHTRVLIDSEAAKLKRYHSLYSSKKKIWMGWLKLNFLIIKEQKDEEAGVMHYIYIII